MATTTSEIVANYFTQAELAGFGILGAIVVVIFGAWRRETSIVTAVATLGICGVAAAVGARLYWFILHPANFDVLFTVEAGFSSFGAILGGGAAVAALRYPMFDDTREFRRTMDALIPAGLCGLAFARLGCIANGCDYGTPAELPWAIQYHAGTEVIARHEFLGYIQSGDLISAPVHPLPLYLMLGVVVAVFVTNWMTRPSGAAAGWATLVYASVRAVAENFRSPASTTEFFGISLGVLASVCLALGAIAWLVHIRRTAGAVIE